MKRFVFLFAYLISSLVCHGQTVVRPLRTDAEWALLRSRLVQGSVTQRAFGVNAPNDSAEIVARKNAFMASPFDTGATGAAGQDIYTGWYYKMRPGQGVLVGGVLVEPQPQWHGWDMANAATWARAMGDTAVANRVMEALDRQYTMPRSNISQWRNTSLYLPPTNTVGAQEGGWYLRIDLAVDAVWPYMSSGRRAAYYAWRLPSALYLAKVQHARFLNFFPNRYTFNTTTRIGIASANGQSGWAEPIYEPVTDAYMAVYDGKYKYTHRKADGSLGYRVPRIAEQYNNVQGGISNGYGPFGLMFGVDSCITLARALHQEEVKFGQFATGETSEGPRNGRTASFWKGSHPGFGSYNYEYINGFAHLLFADVLLKSGDSTMIAYKTTEGAHGTQSTVPKRFVDRLVLQARGILNEGPQSYYNTVTEANRICHINPNDLKSVGGQLWPYEAQSDFQFGWAERYFTKLTVLRRAYMRKGRGRNNATAGLVATAWGGAVAAQPGIFSTIGLSAGLITMPGVKRVAFATETAVAPAGAKSWTFIPQVSVAAKSYSWTRLGTTPRTAVSAVNRATMTIHNGSRPLVAGVYRYRFVAAFADGTSETTEVQVVVN
jgi:hypothetical protein